MTMLPQTERISGGIFTSSRRVVVGDRTPSSNAERKTQRWTAAHLQSRGLDWNFVHSSLGSRMETFAFRTGMWQWSQLLAPSPRLDKSGRLGKGTRTASSRAGQGRRNRLVAGGYRQPVGARSFWGQHTGPNPTDRGKKGCKRHVIVDAQGLPLAVKITSASVHDSIPAMELLDAIPPCAGAIGRPRSRPDIFQGDHAYGTPRNFEGTAARGIQSQMQQLGKRDVQHGSGLGVFRYVVERTFTWLGHHRRLRVCYEKKEAHFQAFHHLAAAVICARRLALK